MEASINNWLREDRKPGDLYELIGRRRFDPNRAQLLAAIRAGLRAVMPAQSHSDKAVAARAVSLQRELGRAEGVFSDTGKAAAYDAELLDRLRREYQELSQVQPPWSLPRLCHWLEHERRVHVDRVKTVAEAIVSSGQDSSLKFDTAEVGLAETMPFVPSVQMPPPVQQPPSAGSAGLAAEHRRVFGAGPGLAPPAPDRGRAAPSWTPPAPQPPPPVRSMPPAAGPQGIAPTLFARPATATPASGGAPSRPGPMPSASGRWPLPWIYAAAGGGAVVGLLILIGLVALLSGNGTPHRPLPVPRLPNLPPTSQGPISASPARAPDRPASTSAQGANSAEMASVPATSAGPASPRQQAGSKDRPLPTPSLPVVPDKATMSGPLNLKFPGQDVLIVSEEGQAAVQVDGEWRLLNLARKTPRKILWSQIDRQGRCWLAGEHGLSCLDGDTVESYGLADGLPDKPLAHVFEDSQGRIWISSWGGGVALLEEGRVQMLSIEQGLHDADVNGAVEDARGRIWVAGHSLGAPLSKGGASTYVDGAFEPNGPGAQLAMYVMSIDGDAEGRVYLGCIGGLAIVDPDMTLHKITEAEGLPQRTPQATFIDSQNRIWVGTWGGGVVEIDRQAFKVRPQHALPQAAHVGRIAEDDQGTIWVGSLEGLWRLEDDRWSQVATPQEIVQVRTVATLPARISRQLLDWAAAETNTASAVPAATPAEVPAPTTSPATNATAPATPSATPGPAPNPPPKKPRRLLKAVALKPADGSQTVKIKLGFTGAFVRKTLGEPAFNETVNVKAGVQTVEVFQSLDVSGQIDVLLVVSDAEDKVVHLDHELTPGNSSNEYRTAKANEMLTAFLDTSE